MKIKLLFNLFLLNITKSLLFYSCYPFSFVLYGNKSLQKSIKINLLYLQFDLVPSGDFQIVLVGIQCIRIK